MVAIDGDISKCIDLSNSALHLFYWNMIHEAFVCVGFRFHYTARALL
jgi:hypothetical protein